MILSNLFLYNDRSILSNRIARLESENKVYNQGGWLVFLIYSFRVVYLILFIAALTHEDSNHFIRVGAIVITALYFFFIVTRYHIDDYVYNGSSIGSYFQWKLKSNMKEVQFLKRYLFALDFENKINLNQTEAQRNFFKFYLAVRRDSVSFASQRAYSQIERFFFLHLENKNSELVVPYFEYIEKNQSLFEAIAIEISIFEGKIGRGEHQRIEDFSSEYREYTYLLDTVSKEVEIDFDKIYNRSVESFNKKILDYVESSSFLGKSTSSFASVVKVETQKERFFRLGHIIMKHYDHYRDGQIYQAGNSMAHYETIGQEPPYDILARMADLEDVITFLLGLDTFDNYRWDSMIGYGGGVNGETNPAKFHKMIQPLIYPIVVGLAPKNVLLKDLLIQRSAAGRISQLLKEKQEFESEGV